VAIINQVFAERFFKNEDPIGKHFGFDFAELLRRFPLRVRAGPSRRWRSAFAVFGMKPSNWPGSWKHWKKTQSRNDNNELQS